MSKTPSLSHMVEIVAVVAAGVALRPGSAVFANGGPFLLKYPDGDPAAKGTLARLDPDLRPAREERLRVVEEKLEVTFADEAFRRVGRDGPTAPLVHVSAAYEIENPTSNAVTVDFGFPILRGIYSSPLSMSLQPEVAVRIGEDQFVPTEIISNSVIYGIIRQRSRERIENAVAGDAKLAKLVDDVRATGQIVQRLQRAAREAAGDETALEGAVIEDPDHRAARAALAEYLVGPLEWNERDAALMVEFASLPFLPAVAPRDDGGRDDFLLGRPFTSLGHGYATANLGALAAIGEQKATQFFAQLASRFDPTAGGTYESLFTAWGGDVRERSVDLTSGEVRPREIRIDPEDLRKDTGSLLAPPLELDPTIYARVDYLDPLAPLLESEKASCETILKNLPVIFTFAPMNLLHYRVEFPARTTQTLTVSYRQYAYRDTKEPASFQLAYVLHPASLWKDFGPIHLEVAVPAGIPFHSSVECRSVGTEKRGIPTTMGGGTRASGGRKRTFAIHRATLTEKTGELFLAVDAEAWKKWFDTGELPGQSAGAEQR